MSNRARAAILAVPVLIALALLLFAAAAPAAEYTADVCRHADGTPAPTEGWQHVIADDHPAGDVATSSCAQGGHIDLALGAGVHGKAGGPASVLYTGALPPGHTWHRLQVWAAFQSTPVGPADDPAHAVSGVIAGTPLCAWGKGAGCSKFGSFGAAPLADVNRYTVTPTAPGQPLSLGVVCDSSPGQCPATSGDPYAQMRVWRITVTASYPDPPPVTPGNPSSPPPAGQPGGAAGQARLTIRLRRHGARRVRLTGRLRGADGKPVAGARLVLRRQIGRRATFSRVTTRRDGTFARVLRRGRKTARVSVRWPTGNVSSQALRITRRR